ncbi:hypothetical protein GQ457_07G003850 [Hibiscus cannabinus]
MDLTQISQLLDQTLSPDGQVLRTSTDALDGLSSLPQFPFALLSIAAVVAEFVKQNSWPVLVPELRYAIQSSNAISNGANSEWSTINALTVLHALVRPLQYFLNPKVAKEPVPPQLELIAKEILAPLLTMFHHLVEKVIFFKLSFSLDESASLLKKTSFMTMSYMPSIVAPFLSSFYHDIS